jgi:hypothetical protein
MIWGRLLLMGMLSTGCASVSKRSSLLERAGSPITSAEMHALALDFSRRAIAQIELTADRIMAQTASATIRRTGLLWKINGAIMYQEAALQTDSLGAAGDQLALSAQLERFFERGDGRAAFGEFQPEAIATMSQLEEKARALFGHAFPDRRIPAQVERRLLGWVDRNPLAGLSVPRATLAGEWWAIAGIGAGRAVESFATMEQAAQTVSERLAFANEFTAKQVRWNGELLLIGDPDDASVRNTLISSSNAFDELARLAKSAPSMLSTILNSMRQERAAVLKDIDAQRVATLNVFSSERESLFENVARERAIVVNSVRAERAAAQADLDRTVGASFDRATQLADHIIVRMAILCAGSLAVIALLLFAALRRRAPRPERPRGQIAARPADATGS